MRRFGLIAALILCPLAAAKADVMAVCGDLAAQQTRHSATAPLLPASRSVLAEQEASHAGAQIALWQDSSGYDVFLNWGDLNQRSLRAEGAEILGNELGVGFVHLIVARAGMPSLEHFLFSFEDSRPGELIWSAARDADDEDSGMLTLESVCVRAK